ncbi:putative receptor-like protein kinase [Hibiscus syriacus]|uniref:non-specific serine/threonine protein kinase n=1 Tax=Hibiscus syriacus TaxID=106335 RepID=A0A6A2X4G1_HIBSY|nr:putative receptor-like protein kinase [Hibiscus syriacus]
MSSQGALNAELSKKTTFLGLKLWVLICISVGAFIVLILGILSVWVTFRRRSRQSVDKFSHSQIPNVSKEIKVDKVGVQSSNDLPENLFISVDDKSNGQNSEKMLAHLGMRKSSDPDNTSQCSSFYHHERGFSSHSGDEGSSGTVRKQSAFSYGGLVTASPLVAENVIGEGGYGVVYKGRLINGTEVAVKKILNNLGQAEKEFRVEVEAIGHVRHKNLVRLLGYCIEGVHRMLVYEYVNNGNLEQWLHGAMRQHSTLTWEVRMKVIRGTAKALAYLHEAIEPKVVHRDIKSSNILIDDNFNAKVSDFGLAKLWIQERVISQLELWGHLAMWHQNMLTLAC